MAVFHILEGFVPYVKGTQGVKSSNPVSHAPGAYCAVIKETGMVYVGSSANLAGRTRNNLWTLKQNRHCNNNLQKAYNDDPEIKVYTKCTESIEAARALEQRLVDEFKDSGYLCNIGTTDVTRTTLGIKRPHTAEHKQKIGHGNRGKTVSDESKILMSNSRKEFLKTERGLAITQSKSRKVTINDIEYPSISAASRVFNVTPDALKRRYL